MQEEALSKDSKILEIEDRTFEMTSDLSAQAEEAALKLKFNDGSKCTAACGSAFYLPLDFCLPGG